MPLRMLAADDAEALVPFVAMAAFPPREELPPGALETPHVRRWLDGWGDELGVVWEDDGCVVAAAWARLVDPVLARDNTGQALPEVIISVAPERRGTGLGRRLMQALMSRAYAEGHAGLALSVSERNGVAVRLYEHLGFAHVGGTPSGLLTWSGLLWGATARRTDADAVISWLKPDARGMRWAAADGSRVSQSGARSRISVWPLGWWCVSTPSGTNPKPS